MHDFAQALLLIFTGDAELWGIIWVTLRMSFFSTVISSLIGLSLGAVIGSCRFPGQNILLNITSTLMSLPPVVAGLLVFMLLSRSGPFGQFRLLYTVEAMVIAQVVLITPIIAGMSAAVLERQSQPVLETCAGLGMSFFRSRMMLLWDCRSQLVSVVLAGLGRSLAEVGAVQLVGGNVQGKTRVMTTAIMLETNMGRFDFALALGVILLILAFILNIFARRIERRTHSEA